MSILIKGIDLPKKIKAQHQHSSEYECETYIELYIRSDGVVFDDEFEEVGQAIQIDRPHGRLIDRDDIYIGRWDIDTDLAEQIQNAPTIFEAEE